MLDTDDNFEQVFIIITAVGFVWLLCVLPETKGLPLEEVAAPIGDEDEVAFYQQDIQLDAKTHGIVLDQHARKVSTENVEDVKRGAISQTAFAYSRTEGV
jgi:hypothetical protein